MTLAAKLASNLSQDARSALTNVGTSRMGAILPAGTSTEVLAELKAQALVGPLGGLTIRGGAVRDRIQDEDLDSLFPL